MKLLKIFIFGLMVILISRFVYSQWYAIVITNTQSIPTPSPFQQDIAICNGILYIGNNFAYVNNVTLFNQINSNGSNVYFTTTWNSTPNIYSWYEGKLNNNGVTCDVWWIKLPNGIPANSNIAIYMYIGSSSANYYSQYYPYVGEAPQLSSTYGQYDNGNYVFLFYDNFAGTTLNTSKWISAVYGITITVNNGLTIQSSGSYADGGIITSSSFPTNTIFDAYLYSFIVQSSSYNSEHGIGVQVGNSAISNGYEYTSWTGSNSNGGTISYGAMEGILTNFLAGPTFPFSNSIISGYWVSTGNEGFGVNYYFVSTNNNAISNAGYNYYAIGAYFDSQSATSVWYWARIRYMPPNNVMPSISIQLAASVSSVQLSPSSSSSVCPGTQTSSTVTANLNNPGSTSTTVTFSCSAPSDITCSFNPSSCTTSGSSCSTTLYVDSSSTIPPGPYSVTVTASTQGSSASTTYTYNISGPSISISSQQSSNFQNSYNIYITGYCVQNYTLYVNNSLYCYDSYSQSINTNASCTVSYPGSYSVYAQGCSIGTCVNSNTINLNIPPSGITVPIIDINILNITNQNINTTISVNGSNQNIQSINVYYNNNNVYSNSNVNTNYYSFNLQLPYSNNGNITVCSTLTNGQSGCVTEIFNLNVAQTYIYYGIIQLQATIQPININTTYGPIGNNLEFSLDSPEYILTLNITNIGNITLNNITINLQQLGNVPEILYNQIPIESLNNINISQLQPNQSYILQFNILPLYIGSSSLLFNFNVNGQNIGNTQYNLVVNGPSNRSSLVVSENINYILILLGIIGSIIFLI